MSDDLTEKRVDISLWLANRLPPGAQPEYRFKPEAIDMLPIGTFLVKVLIGTGGFPDMVGRIVKPNDPGRYRAAMRTPGNRLVYVCWAEGEAVKQLYPVVAGATQGKPLHFRYIVQPGDEGFDLLDAFKLGCDHARAMSAGPVSFPAALACRAVGWKGPGSLST